MSNYWAIAIGINQYKNFQPLLYAQWDAQALWTYWVQEGGIPQTQCMLLTDRAAPDRAAPDRAAPDQNASARGSAIQPTKKTIEQQLVEWGHHRVSPEDTLWCFFSGYGVNHQGKDYLMPLDGDPGNIEQTGIAADAFFSTLKAASTDRIVVLLDLKRGAKGDVSAADPLAANAQAPDHRVGDDIARQAQQAGIATILASQPDQFSHETLTLRQGLFTAGLLEGLRTHGCFQLGQLSQYLENRLPELSEYYWRPRQDPMMIIPEAQRQQVLLDPVSRQPTTVGVRSGPSTPLTPASTAPASATPSVTTALDPSLNPPISLPADLTVPAPLSSLDLATDLGNGDQLSDASGLPFPPLAPTPESDATDRRLQGSTVKLPVLGKELSYTPTPSTIASKTILPPTLNTPLPSPAPSPSEITDSAPPEPIPVEDNLVDGPRDNDGDDKNGFWSSIFKYWLPLLALMILVVLKLNWSALSKQTALMSTPDEGTSSPVPVADPTNGDSVGDGNGNGNGNGAIAPPEASSPVPEGFPSSPTDPSPETSTDNASGEAPDNNPDATAGNDLATDADSNTDINGNAANDNSSDSNDEDSGLFPGLFGDNPSDGSGGNALDQAKAATAIGNYEDAAIWLSQVPVEAQTEEYERLRTEVDTALSEQGQANRELLDRAIASLNEARLETRVNQASDFGRAIAIANQIQPGQPLYDEAQSYILRWGEVIMDLAKSRAQSGQYEKAIATVSLIEDDLPVLYPKAQELLAGWQDVMGVDNSSQAIIDAAKVDITRFPDQAFPYNRGIGKLREIDSDEPLYTEAQRLIDEWSQEILNIATRRAQQGDTQLAIDTAKYVPQDTAAYSAALAAIDQWSQ